MRDDAVHDVTEARDALAADLLDDDRLVTDIAAEPAVLGRNVGAQETDLARLGPQVAIDEVLLAPASVVGHDLALDEAARGVAEELELVVHPGGSGIGQELLRGCGRGRAADRRRRSAGGILAAGDHSGRPDCTAGHACCTLAVYGCALWRSSSMETPLTPLEFARRARKVHADRLAVVDGTLRFTYEQFLARCDRWSAALQRLGVGTGDRVAYHRAEHARASRVVLRGAAARRGHRADQLPADAGRLRSTSSSTAARRSSVSHSDYLDAVDSIRGRVPGGRALRRARGRAARLARLRSDARCGVGRVRRSPTSPRPICSRSTTRAAPPRGPRA